MSALNAHPRRWLIFGLLAAAQFMVILDASVIVVALASIQEALGFTAGELQWVVNGYVVAFGGLLLLGGRVADLVGRRRTFMAGLAVFSLASLAGGLAQSELWLIAARAVQGLGAAFAAPAALSLVMTVFTDPGERTKAMGLWGAVSGAAGAAGVLAGGTLTEGLGWESTLLVNVPIGAALLVAVARVVPETRSEGTRGFDAAGAITVVGGLALLIYGIVGANDAGWVSPTTIGTFAVAVALLVAFVWVEHRAAAPLVDLRLLTSRTVGRANLVSLVAAAAQAPMFYFGGLLMQQVLGYSALEAGLAWLPMSVVVMAFAGGAAPKLIARFGASTVLAAGAAVMAAGMVVWAQAADAGSYLTGVLPALLVTAPGMALVFVAVTVSATSGVSEQQSGLASGLVNMTQQIGGAVGLAILVAFSTSRTTSAAEQGAGQAEAVGDGFSAAFALGGGFALLAALATVLLLVRTPRRTDAISVHAAA